MKSGGRPCGAHLAPHSLECGLHHQSCLVAPDGLWWSSGHTHIPSRTKEGQRKEQHRTTVISTLLMSLPGSPNQQLLLTFIVSFL